MKNSLLLNNFFSDRSSDNGRQESGRTSRQSAINLDLSASNRSAELYSPRDASSRMTNMTTSPRDISTCRSNRTKSTRVNDSRRNSTSSQNLDSDEDISVSDLEDDDYVDNNFGNKANNYWANLDNSIKKINDDSDKLALKPRPNFKSSDDFKGVMEDMSGNVEYGVSKGYTLLKQKISRMTNVTSITALALSNVSNNPAQENGGTEIKSPDDEVSDDEIKAVTDRENKEKDLVSSVKGAKRAWRVLKTHVNESGHESRTATVKLNWEALRHHVAGITDLDKARQDLYERYGFLPTVQEDGTMACKNVMWLNRTRAQIIQNESNIILNGRTRAQSARPFSVKSRERQRHLSGNNMKTKRPVSCDISSGISRLKVRPSSEKVTRPRLRPTSSYSSKPKQ